MTSNKVKEYLLSVRDNWNSRSIDEIKSELNTCKTNAISKNDEKTANKIWELETILEAQTKFIQFFILCKENNFYDAWCALERSEHAIAALRRHRSIDSEFELHFIKKYIAQFQTLFPYKMFMSPEFVKMKKKCSICKSPISLRNPCGHRVGEVYMGEMCGRIVENIELAGMALVENPVQKYSVPFTAGDESGKWIDQYDYTLIQYATSALASPFHNWSYEQSEAWHPHSKFRNVGRNDPCPCGTTPLTKYKKCCLAKPGILRPHFQFTFEETPPDGFISYKYNY